MKREILFAFGFTQACLVMAQGTNFASALTEQDFLGEMPIVLSVSRLAQRLDDAPGAVTILDSNFIRMSGARDVADLLRVVPGFQTTTTFETDAPMASYHGRIDDWSNRLQVLVDGRSVYSSALQGSVGLGLQTLTIDDIERIEILRGSNSAAYGARAFLGVVNIVSKEVRQTLGTRVQIGAGENGVADLGVSHGWGDETESYRLTADSRGDDGLRKTGSAVGDSGANRVNRVNFSGFRSIDSSTELNLRAGFMQVGAYRGDLASPGNLQRLRYMASEFAQADWRKTLSADEEFQINLSLTRFQQRDSFIYLESGSSPSAYSGIEIGFNSAELNSVLSVQHTRRYSDVLRAVIGVELRAESIVSPSSFDGFGDINSRFNRLFANAEWRVIPAVVFNLGALAEQSTFGGSTFSPRLMVNWHLADAHTVRGGVSTAFRPPSPYEKYALVNFYDVNGANPLTYIRATGNLVPEKVLTRELGYHLNAPKFGIDGDLRIFKERITDGIRTPYTTNGPPQEPDDFVNSDDYEIAGAEFQIEWRPTSNTRLFMSQTWTDISNLPQLDPADRQPFRVKNSAARLAGSMALMHSFSSGTDVSIVYHDANGVCLMSCSFGTTFSMARTDLRIAKRFRIGKTRAEVAATVQNISVPYADGDSKFFFDQRGLVSLRLEY